MIAMKLLEKTTREIFESSNLLNNFSSFRIL